MTLSQSECHVAPLIKMDTREDDEMTENGNKWRETVEKLMRKAEDPATSQVERDAIMDKVTYLMSKFGIEQDMLRFSQHKPLTARMQKFVVNAPYASQKVILLNGISKAFDCFAVRNNDGKISIFGTEDDLEKVFMLYASLVIQMMSAMSVAVAEKPAHIHGKSFNTSFTNGFVHTVLQRIREAVRRAKSDVQSTVSGNGMELVLVNKAQVVRNAVRDVFPNLSYGRSSYSRTSSSAGYAAGMSAGQRADIGGSRISNGSRREIGN